MVGGELGYTVGTIYTSLTGFSNETNAGSVQLAALGKLLCQNGFTMWDLGMDMDYKQDLGTHLMPRSEYVAYVHRIRQQTHIVLETIKSPVNAREILDRVPVPPPSTQSGVIGASLPTETTSDHSPPRLSPTTVQKTKKQKPVHDG
mmetsp:Transcript_40110/g.56507  ORF Transcript_40110/g.56507 Transcript_40110/m.56507 type:complete len:146 (+) Transcript_40110:464-901(+)|eukprot:CAMPEP_0202456478 /NCGR_PEP_ID=MMETSP1360-20130828/13717_1 /ASSEMBLY_ACC=CAM_ASM_000848 /TAXON_ID=515479 /ORGANISM="Licmophora paradoxa, Strain CCMP2313" /LENGTH=145 /DNA_ID=CAMNT_0049076283 /DNA_START=440 /DNA_END=877 /DNA_ORIENTATION=+